MAIIYEVNLKVAHVISQQYLSWLHDHIPQMLQNKGFQSATLYEEAQQTQGNEPSLMLSYIVQYKVNSRADLEYYFAHHASRMREEGLRLFGDKFSASRRILSELPLKSV